MKHLKLYLATTTTVLLFAANTAHADMASGTYSVDSSTTVPIWDISGEYTGNLDGLDVDFTITENGTGQYQGDGTFTYSSSVNLSGDINVAGKFGGTSVKPTVPMSLALSGTGTANSDDIQFAAKAKVTFGVDVTDAQLLSNGGGSVSATVTDLTTHKKKSANQKLGETTFPLPASATGDWTLSVNLTPNGTKYTGTATLQTSAGGSIQYAITGTYSSKTDTSNIKLVNKSGGLTMVVSTSGATMTVKSIKGKAYGQSVNFKAP